MGRGSKIDFTTLIGTGIAVFLTFTILIILLVAFFIWSGGKFFSIKNNSYYHSILTTIAILIMSIMGALLASGFSILIYSKLTNLGWFLGPIFALLIIKEIFKTNFKKAFKVWIFSIITSGILTIVITVLVYNMI